MVCTYVYNSPDMFTLSPWASGSLALDVHIMQTNRVHVTNIKCSVYAKYVTEPEKFHHMKQLIVHFML